MTFSPDAVANEFLDSAKTQGAEISPMKMQKLVYYAHGWHLALQGKPLINETVQAWRYGPVIQSLYREFKQFGSGPIMAKAVEVKRNQQRKWTIWYPSLEAESAESNVASYAKALVSKIWSLYQNYTAGQLSTLTHQTGTPWHTVVSTFPPGEFLSGVAIPDELIEEFFKGQLKRGA